MLVRDYIKLMQTWPQDEPIFVLRGQDCLANNVVEFWAREAESVGVNEEKIQEARNCGHAMQMWPQGKVPD